VGDAARVGPQPAAADDPRLRAPPGVVAGGLPLLQPLRLADPRLRPARAAGRRRPAGPLRPRRRARNGGHAVSSEALLEITDLWVTYWGRSLLGLGGKPFHAVK